MPYKSIGAEIEDIDVKSRTIVGYASVFGVIDSDKDMLVPGFYKKTLQENGHRVRHIWQHDLSKPLAKPKELSEDQKGLRFVSVLSDTSIGRDVIKWYNDGVIDEHSVGIEFMKGESTRKDGYIERRQGRLWEFSSVTLAANEYALGGISKSRTKEDVLKRMDVIYKALRDASYENDELFVMLDIYHRQMKEMLHTFTSSTPAAEAPEPQTEEVDKHSRLAAQLRIQQIANILTTK